jgi:adenosylmethionine---8-amino-7-oxononanoate aminotransferase
MPIWRPLTQAKHAPPPLEVTSARGPYLTLKDGQEILNCVSSWWFNTVGHAHPSIAEAVYRQLQAVEHVNFADFTHEPAERLCERVIELAPGDLSYGFFSDNGSTAVEVAIKIALQYWHNLGETQRNLIVRFEGGYHGDTFGGMALGFDSPYYRPFANLLFDVATIPFPDHIDKEGEALEALEQILGGRCAAIVIEPLIQGAAGMRICRPEFLQALEYLARKRQVLVIYDEVMTGFGRTGDWFAAIRAGTRPDLLCLSKGLSGGYLPIALTLATPTIYDAFLSDDPYKTFAHSHSFGGSALGCAAALAALDLLSDEPFRPFEGWHREEMTELAKHPRVVNPRVCGTCAAFEVKSDQPSGYYNQVGKLLKTRLLERGFYFRPLGNTFFFLPPYCVTRDQLAAAYSAVRAELDRL